MAQRLRSILRPSDTVASFGGDEFALLCDGVGLAAVEHIAERIEEAFSTPFVIEGYEVPLSGSTGIVLATDPDFDPDQLMSDADLAMYATKQGGRGHHTVFVQGMRGHPPAFTSKGANPESADPSVGPASRS